MVDAIFLKQSQAVKKSPLPSNHRDKAWSLFSQVGIAIAPDMKSIQENAFVWHALYGACSAEDGGGGDGGGGTAHVN